jgi:antitoxin component YwqK of YwqJK toxin-antitoxin module
MENNIFGERFILISENKKYEEIANFIKQKLGKPATKIIPNGLLKGRFLEFNFRLAYFSAQNGE